MNDTKPMWLRQWEDSKRREAPPVVVQRKYRRLWAIWRVLRGRLAR